MVFFVSLIILRGPLLMVWIFQTFWGFWLVGFCLLCFFCVCVFGLLFAFYSFVL